MNSSNVWGNSPTTRWEFNKPKSAVPEQEVEKEVAALEVDNQKLVEKITELTESTKTLSDESETKDLYNDIITKLNEVVSIMKELSDKK